MKKWFSLLTILCIGFVPVCFADNARSHDVLQTLPGVENTTSATTNQNPGSAESTTSTLPKTVPEYKKQNTHHIKHAKNHRHHSRSHLAHRKTNHSKTRFAHKKTPIHTAQINANSELRGVSVKSGEIVLS